MTTTVIVTTPAQTYSIADTTTGDTISVLNGPVESGFQTTEVMIAGTAYVLANQSEITISGSNDGDNVVLDNPNPATGLQELAISQLGTGGTINGSNSNQSTTTPDIAVPTLFLDAYAGIGTNRALQTQATTITAVAGTGAAGNIDITNGVSASTPLTANLQATNAAGGFITLTNAGAVSVTTNGGGIIATNSITLTTTGSTADLDVGNGAEISSSQGSVSTGAFIAGDLNLGDGNGQGTLQAAAGITIGVTHNVTMNANAAVINLTSGNIFLTAGGNFTMLESPGTVAGEPVIVNDASTGSIQLSAGPGGTLTLDSTGADAVESNNGFITLTGDGIVINKAVNSGTARTSLVNASVGQAITIGGANGPGVIGLTQTELNRITAGVVQIGSSTAGNITIAAPLADLTGSNVLVLDSNGSVSQSLFGSLAALDLAVESGGSVALSNSKNDVSLIAASTTGAFSFVNAPGDALTVATVAGVFGITTTNAPISLTADAITLQQPINAGGQIVTFTPATATQQIQLGANNAAGILGITDAELGMITAAALVLEAGGNISIAGTVSHHANLGNMQLITDGAISQSAALTIADLALESAAGITLTNGGNAISVLGFYNASGAVSITDTGALVIGGVDSVSSSTNLGGATSIQTTGNILISSAVWSASAASLTSTAGAIFDETSGAVVDVTAPSTLLMASTGIGVANDPLETQVSTLGATTATGGIFIANGKTAPVTLSVGLIEVSGASGDIVLTNNGTIDSISNGNNIQGPGNVTVKATGASSDINLSGQASLFSVLGTGSGLVDVEAGRDINLGGSGNNSYGAIGAETGSIKVVAGRNFTMNANANLQVEGGSGGITVTAGGAFTMLTTPGNLGNSPIILADGAGTIALAAGAGQLMTINSTGANAVETNNGNITLTADAMFIDSGVNAGTGNVQYQPTTAGLQIGLGSASVGGLQLDDAELNNATAKTLTVGNATAGEITLGGTVNPTHITNLTLTTGGNFNGGSSTITIGAGILTIGFGENNLGDTANLSGDTITAGTVDVTGGTGNDTIIVGAGSETINGGGGVDTVDFSGTRAQYAIAMAAGGVVTVTQGSTTDTLSGISFLSFSDTTVSLQPPMIPTTGLRYVGAGRSGAPSDTMVWQNSDGTPTLWTVGSGGTTQVTLEPDPGPGWQIAALGDLNSDGSADLLLQYSNGMPAVWFMNGTTLASSAFLPNPGPGWSILGAGDFYDTGHDNSILLQSTGGLPVIWEASGATVINSAVLPNPGSGWSIVGTGDFFDTGFDNTILLQNTASGLPVLWEMNSGTLVNSVALPNPGPGWSIRAEGNFFGDGHNDSILLQSTGGLPVLWQMNGATIVTDVALPNPGPNWTILGVGEVTGNGVYDIFLQNTNGMTAEWSMHGSQLQSSSFLTSNTLTMNGVGNTTTGNGSELITFNAANQTFIDGPTVYTDTLVGFSQSNGDRIHLTTDTVADALAHTTLVDGGHDTQILLANGSAILLKGVTSIDGSSFA